MPVNMDPSKKRRPSGAASPPSSEQARPVGTRASSQPGFGDETAADKEKDLADAESKNLWDATEVIDMDKV